MDRGDQLTLYLAGEALSAGPLVDALGDVGLDDLVEAVDDLNPAVGQCVEGLGLVVAGEGEAVHDALRASGGA